MPSLLIQAGKDSNIYVLNRDNLGKNNPSNNSQIYQELPGALPGGVFASPAYFNGWVYYSSVKNSLRQFQFTNSATLDPVPFSASGTTFGFPGTTPSVSSSGNQNGIVWAYEFGQNSQAILHAYDATNVAHELYNSSQVQIGGAVKFSVPTVCNGKVFVGTANSVAVFGLFSGPTSTPPEVTKDFDNDNEADLVWENEITGEHSIWTLKNGAWTGVIPLPTIPTEWHIAGTGDFLGTGQVGLVWEDTVTGARSIWTLNKGAWTGVIPLPTIPTEWHIAGAGDFLGTGLAALVWEDTITGARSIWTLNKGAWTGVIMLPTIRTQWHIEDH